MKIPLLDFIIYEPEYNNIIKIFTENLFEVPLNNIPFTSEQETNNEVIHA
jgi:hypothetical protein